MSKVAPTHTRTYRRLVEGTTINRTTLLSTDYLNHFNEVVMMLELSADMPEMFSEIEAWRPKTYEQHFLDSVFSHKDLAIAAYHHVPAEFRKPFDDTVARIERMVMDAAPRLRATLDGPNHEAAKFDILEVTRQLRSLIERASAIINGACREDLASEDAHAETVMDQSDIDALFD